MSVHKVFQRFFNMRKSVFSKMFIFSLLPVLIITFLTFSVYTHYVSVFKTETIQGYKTSLNIIAESLDNTLQEIFNTALLLSTNQDFFDILYTTNPQELKDFYKIDKTIHTLDRFRTVRQLIDSTYIFIRDEGIVISHNGTSHHNVFFKRYYNYDKYSANDFLQLSFTNQDTHILKPSLVRGNTPGAPKYIIPIVMSGFGGVKGSNLFVINIDESAVFELLKQHKLTPNSQLLMINSDGNIFSSTGHSVMNSPKVDKKLLDRIILNNSKPFQHSIDGKKTLVISYNSNHALLNDFIYVAMVPISDLYDKTSYIQNTAYGVSLFSLLFAIALSYMLSRKLYYPVENLITFLKQGRDNSELPPLSTDEFGYIKQEIGSILSNAKKLEKKLSLALPLVCEQHLLKILQHNESYLGEETLEFLKENGVTFKYPNFLAAIMRLRYSDQFYKTFTMQEQLVIQGQIIKIVHFVFQDSGYNPYILTIDTDKLAVIVNLEDEENEERIAQYFENINRLFEHDQDLLLIYSGMGRIHKGIEGLQQSFREAANSSALFSSFDTNRVSIYKDQGNGNKYSYSINEENTLINYLIGGYKKETLDLLQTIISRNIENNVSDAEMKELYIHLYKTGKRILRDKDITTREFMGDQYKNISAEYHSMQTEEVSKYVMQVLDKIVSLGENCKTDKIDVSEIIKYIDLNYDKDIYLDQIADMYNTSPQYLSKLLRDALGVTFHNYLSSLRIMKAKSLLLNTEDSIDNIAVQCGFHSRHTFIRMFKKLEGVTPTQYRNIKNHTG